MKSKNPFFRFPRAALAVTMVFLAAGAAFLYVNKPGESHFLPPCFFHTLTGLYCPGCGTTRMAYSLLHLDFYGAARSNILALLCVPLILYELMRYGAKVFLKKSLPSLLYQPIFSGCLVAVVIVFWVFRNLPFPPFSWLAPAALL